MLKKTLSIMFVALLACSCSDDNDSSRDPVCGNGTKEAGEECDDGNTVGGDGCSSECKLETSAGAVCGNGTKEAGEECDDGNTVGGDGCSSECKLETSTGAVCGNGTKEAGEKCDDGNTVGGDGCSSECKLETSVGAVCGNGTKEAGEECDKNDGVPSSCAAWDSSSSWTDGEAAVMCSSDCKLDTSNCVLVKCGDEIISEGEICDRGTLDDAVSCNDIGAGPWKSGGMPACNSTCNGLTEGSCELETCGNGKLDDDEECDDSVEGASYTCADYDSKVAWKDGGAPECRNCRFTLGTCNADISEFCNNGKWDVEVEEPCDWKYWNNNETIKNCVTLNPEKYVSGTNSCNTACQLDTSGCVPRCGNGTLEEGYGEECDWGSETTKNCTEIDTKYASGKATCSNECRLNTSACVEGESRPGFYHCQLMNPVSVTYTASKTSELMTVHYGIGSDIVESEMMAKLVYGTDLKDLSQMIEIDATQNATADVFTASLTRDQVVALASSVVYYTFKISTDGGVTWGYCKMNQKDPQVLDVSLKPKTWDGDTSSKLYNEHEIGSAVVSSLSDIIFNFTFDSATFASYNIRTSEYAAESGEATLRGWPEGTNSGPTCNGNSCRVNGNPNSGGALVTVGYPKDKPSNAATAKGIVIKTSTKSLSSLRFSFDYAVSNLTGSPNLMDLYYSTDSGKNWTAGPSGVQLSAEEKGAFYSRTIDLESVVNNQASLWILMVPYGGTSNSGNIRIDNLSLAKK